HSKCAVHWRGFLHSLCSDQTHPPALSSGNRSRPRLRSPLCTPPWDSARARVLAIIRDAGGTVQRGQRALAEQDGVSPARLQQSAGRARGGQRGKGLSADDGNGCASYVLERSHYSKPAGVVTPAWPAHCARRGPEFIRRIHPAVSSHKPEEFEKGVLAP